MGSLHLFRDLPEVKPYAAGEYIFRKGEEGKVMYLVIEGEIDLLVAGAVAETAASGTFIGEMSLIQDAPRSGSARARSDCRVFPIDAARFQTLVQQTPSFALDVMKSLAQRLRRANVRAGAKHAERKQRATPHGHKRRTP
jgi:CRP/FNR family cyclic AMP-dependent transcriptional regulator